MTAPASEAPPRLTLDLVREVAARIFEAAQPTELDVAIEIAVVNYRQDLARGRCPMPQNAAEAWGEVMSRVGVELGE